MRIAILGAGNVGGSAAVAAVRAGHDVVVSATTGESAQKAAAAAGATAASNAEAVRGADVVLLAVPHAAVGGLVADLGDAMDGAVVADATNPLNDTVTDLTTSGVSAAEQLQERLPRASVVKAFNTVLASRLGDPVEGGTPLDAFLAGDDATAKERVGMLASSLGFRVVDTGGLRMARALEEMAFLHISLNARNGWSWRSGWAIVGPTGGA